MGGVNTVQYAFRFYEDDASESTNTAIDLESTNITRVVVSNSALCLRVGVRCTTGTTAATDDYQLQYSKNAGAYVDVTTSSNDIKAINSSFLTDNDPTTERLTSPASFLTGEISEDGLVDDFLLSATRCTEFLYPLSLVYNDLSDGDTLDFRVLRNAAVLNSYLVTPRITISKSGGGGGGVTRKRIGAAGALIFSFAGLIGTAIFGLSPPIIPFIFPSVVFG